MIKQSFMLTAALALLVLASCKKAGNSQSAAEKNASAEMKKINAMAGGLGMYPTFPTVEDGVLVFKDGAQFEEYIAFLDAATDPKNYDSATLREKEFDQDAILETIENYMGFTSVRKISHDHFLQLCETGWASLEDIPEEHFILDNVMRSVLNADLNMKIADFYVHYINKNLSVKIDASKSDLLEAFTSLPETSTLDDALQIDAMHQFSTVYETMGTGNLSIFGGGKFTPHVLGYVGIVNLNVTSSECGKPKKKYFENMQMREAGSNYGDPGSTLPASYNVDFGDGTPHLTIHSVLNGFYETVPTFTHTYANAGTYTVHITAQADYAPPGGGASTASLDKEVIVKASDCKITDNKRIGTEQFHPVPDGSRAVSGRILIENYEPWSGSGFNNRIVIETSSWLKDGNNWKPSKSEIYQDLHTDKHDDLCNIIGPIDGSGWSSSSKHILTHRTDPAYPWDIINTHHGIKYHGVWYVSAQSLSVCD